MLSPVSRTNGFDPHQATNHLQEAVRAHDAELLDELVSDQFIFVSGRSISRLGRSGFDEQPGKAEWIAAAQAIDWQSFQVGQIRSIDLGQSVVVDCRLSQVVRRGGRDEESRWVVTDVWTLEGIRWRLIARHPELMIPLGD